MGGPLVASGDRCRSSGILYGRIPVLDRLHVSVRPLGHWNSTGETVNWIAQAHEPDHSHHATTAAMAAGLNSPRFWEACWCR